MAKIYKIVSMDLWRQALAVGALVGAPVDLADGFIHFSNADQVEETARRHFAGQENLMLLEVVAEELGSGLKYEISRGGALFPHLYGTLVVSKVSHAWPLPQRADGDHDFMGLLS